MAIKKRKKTNNIFIIDNYKGQLLRQCSKKKKVFPKNHYNLFVSIENFIRT